MTETTDALLGRLVEVCREAYIAGAIQGAIKCIADRERKDEPVPTPSPEIFIYLSSACRNRSADQDATVIAEIIESLFDDNMVEIITANVNTPLELHPPLVKERVTGTIKRLKELGAKRGTVVAEELITEFQAKLAERGYIVKQ